MITTMIFKLWKWMNSHKNDVSAHHTDHKVASAESGEFKEINIVLTEAYKIGTKIVLRIKDLNTFVGEDAGKVTTGNWNNFMGYRAGYSNTTGYYNNFMGRNTGYKNTTGNNNNFMGGNAGASNTTGYRNCFIGTNAGYGNISGHKNVMTGYRAGYSNTTGDGNIFMGYDAGFYETGTYKLFIDNLARSNEADGRVKALIYGIFNAATANQLLRTNAKKVEMPMLGNYVNDAAAAADGIAVGGLYRNGNNVQVRIV